MPGIAPVGPVSVVICAYTMQRWDALLGAVESVLAQQEPPTEVIVVVDHNPVLYKRLLEQLDHVLVVENDRARGLSGARNTGVLASSGRIVAFLDDDARAEPGWLAAQLSVYRDPAVLAVGGRIEPLWEAGRRPRHLPPELDWIVGCSYRGLPQVAAQVRNVIGASMSFRRTVFDRAGLFDDRMGRTDALRGCEETELCVRATSVIPGGRVVYEPASLVHHQVPAPRTRLRYLLARAWGEGASKAVMARATGSANRLSSERRYVARVLPRAVVREVSARSWGGMSAAGAIVAVLAATASGYLAEVVRGLGPTRRAGTRVGRAVSDVDAVSR